MRKRRFQVGDVVRLNSEFFKMTVSNVEETVVTCIFFYQDTLKEYSFNSILLTHV